MMKKAYDLHTVYPAILQKRKGKKLSINYTETITIKYKTHPRPSI
jgi:hypothetical protein